MKGLERLNQQLNHLRPLLQKGSITEQVVNYLKINLPISIPFISSPIFKRGFVEIKRVSINKNLPGNNNKRILETKFLKYPQPESVKKYGRANYIGQNILYATLDASPITAFDEMKPKIGDKISISTWKIKDDVEDLLISSICKITSKDDIVHNKLSLGFIEEYQNALSQHDFNTAQQIDTLFDFISECFAKDVDYGNNYDYFLSAYFANKILYDLFDGKTEAIVYPSVASELTSSNIAIKPAAFDLKYKFKEVEECIVTSTPSENGSGFSNSLTGRATDIDNGIILWE